MPTEGQTTPNTGLPRRLGTTSPFMVLHVTIARLYWLPCMNSINFPLEQAYIINSMHFAATPPSFLPTHPGRPNTLAQLALQKQKTLKILAVLATALNKSLAVYAHALYPTPPSAPSAPTSKGQTVIEILSDQEENPIQHNRNSLPATNPSKPLKKTTSQDKPGPLLSKGVEMSPTSEEPHKETPPHSPHPSKTKPIKKNKPQRKESDFHVEIPQLDPIETTSLPEKALSRGDIGRLKEGLMRRQVDEWVYAGKKQKKEIRLLGV